MILEHMIDTIMFDLDGTLLRYTQDEFLRVYFTEIRKVFIRLGLEPDAAIKGIWVGTYAMVENDGSMLNTQRFWNAFSKLLDIKGERLKTIEAACDSFYSNEFNAVKAVMAPGNISTRLVREVAAKGYDLILATNPLFPPCAVDSRLGWIGLSRQDFKLITHYENSTFCKPNLDYYREIFTKTKKSPQQCLMVGNNPTEDMCVGQLGSETFLITDYMENEAGMDIAVFRHGTIGDLEAYLMSLPVLEG